MRRLSDSIVSVNGVVSRRRGLCEFPCEDTKKRALEGFVRLFECALADDGAGMRSKQSDAGILGNDVTCRNLRTATSEVRDPTLDGTPRILKSRSDRDVSFFFLLLSHAKRDILSLNLVNISMLYFSISLGFGL